MREFTVHKSFKLYIAFMRGYTNMREGVSTKLRKMPRSRGEKGLKEQNILLLSFSGSKEDILNKNTLVWQFLEFKIIFLIHLFYKKIIKNKDEPQYFYPF